MKNKLLIFIDGLCRDDFIKKMFVFNQDIRYALLLTYAGHSFYLLCY